ncbi:hypothetical protein [Roseisolibacter agri]|uniref:Outer membrane protein beta-barrel domain-containing protein n=1 Tax=Roseisolibacter agri TaxID=2014610 RepID=A0AA37Q8P4_9BACT|nr:hypothetical protein [Roseisolibacter agri]GLC25772.1 hypothetical protein rosag_22850 [Roseisolibacter agri]
MSHRPTSARFRTGLATAGLLLVAPLVPAALHAQTQRQLDVHGSYQRGTTTESNAWGAGAQVQLVFGPSSAPVRLGTSLGGDALRPEGGGSMQWNASLDAVAQFGGGAAVTPYVGGSVGANWSTGDEAQWSGARGGLETMAGVQVKLGASDKAPSLKLEERFGYVRGQEHTLGTRVGIVLSL